MKRICKHLSLVLLVCTVALQGYAGRLNTNPLQMENLNRGLVVVPTSQGNFISWRFLGTDNNDTSFAGIGDGSLIRFQTE